MILLNNAFYPENGKVYQTNVYTLHFYNVNRLRYLKKHFQDIPVLTLRFPVLILLYMGEETLLLFSIVHF